MLRLLRRGRSAELDAAPVAAGLLEWRDAAGLLAAADRQAVIHQIKEAVGVPARHFQELYQGLIDRFGEFVQLLPASENHHHAHAGGLLDHSLDVAQKAVAIRRGHLLPPGAEPEVVARQSDRWTYAVFSAALLHDVGKAVLLGQVERLAADGTSLGPWVGWDGAMRGARRYRFRFAPARRYHDYPLVGPFLARMLVPDVAIAWLGADGELMSLWIAALAGDEERGGAVGEIVARADRLSVSASLGVEEGSLPAASRRSPLHVRLSGALRHLIDTAELPVNRRGAGAWVFGDELFVVAKRGIDAMRDRLLADGHTDIPTRNDRIMDELQQRRVCFANGERAVWTVRITMADFDQELTVLRFPLASIWPGTDRRPAAMNGSVTVVGGQASGAPAPVVAPVVQEAEAAMPVLPGEPPAAPVAAAGEIEVSAAAPSPTAGEETGADRHHAPPASGDAASSESDDPVPEPGAPEPADAAAGEAGQPAEPQAFVDWLRAGLASERLSPNQVNALLHVVPEGLLIVSPRAFKVYAAENSGRNWEYVQRRFVRQRWHRTDAGGKGILEYEVRGERKSSRLKGLVVRDPEQRLAVALPTPNRCLIRLSAL